MAVAIGESHSGGRNAWAGTAVNGGWGRRYELIVPGAWRFGVREQSREGKHHDWEFVGSYHP